MSHEVGIRVRLTFPNSLVKTPAIARMVKDFDVIADIRRAEIEETGGWLICELEGESDRIEAAYAWLRSEGIQVDLLGDMLES